MVTAISIVALAVCLIVNIAASARERRYLTGLLMSRNYQEYRNAEDGGQKREFKTAFTKRAVREKRLQEKE